MRSQLLIHKPIVSTTEESSIKVIVDIGEENENRHQLWYSIPVNYAQYLSTEVADPFVVAMLLYAMRKGLDIRCVCPVSERILLMLNNYLIPFLCHINGDLKRIRIGADSFLGRFDGQHCGTGISCGVDSLSTVVQHSFLEDSIFKIDTLTLLNTGYYGCGENSSKQFRTYLSRSGDFCDEFNFRFMSVDSNVATITGYDFLSAHTYLTCSTILLFQKYFRKYYYASGYPVYDFSPDFKDSAFYDVFLLNCISTDSLEFVSSCCTLSRVEKTKLIAEDRRVLKRLYVCFSGNSKGNCSYCEKCVRTMLALDALGLRERIGEAFNSEIYEKNRGRYMSYMLRHRRNNFYYEEIYDAMKKNGIKIPLSAYLNILPCQFELLSFKNRIKTKLSKTILGNTLLNKFKHFR